nr:MAG TPA: hypothetical protein [Caudoviricetes sp.]
MLVGFLCSLRQFLLHSPQEQFKEGCLMLFLQHFQAVFLRLSALHRKTSHSDLRAGNHTAF